MTPPGKPPEPPEPPSAVSFAMPAAPPSDALAESTAMPVTLRFSEAFTANFEILDVLGRGGMGTVFKARQRRLDRIVCIKLVNIVDGEMQDRFLQEGQLLAQLLHPRIISVFDAGVDQNIPYLVCEYVEGRTLRRVLDEQGPQPLVVALDLTGQILDGLAAAHERHVIHRDIKPENILITVEGEVKIADFGLARSSKLDLRRTSSGMLIGTPTYMAPEQITKQPTGPAVDIYATGVVMFEMLTGRPPFDGKTALDVLNMHVSAPVPRLCDLVPELGLPQGLDALVSRALAKAPDDRFPSAAQFARDVADLRNLYSTNPALASRPRTDRAPHTESTRVVARSGLSGLGAGTAMGGGGGSVAHGGGYRPLTTRLVARARSIPRWTAGLFVAAGALLGAVLARHWSVVPAVVSVTAAASIAPVASVTVGPSTLPPPEASATSATPVAPAASAVPAIPAVPAVPAASVASATPAASAASAAPGTPARFSPAADAPRRGDGLSSPPGPPAPSGPSGSPSRSRAEALEAQGKVLAALALLTDRRQRDLGGTSFATLVDQALRIDPWVDLEPLYSRLLGWSHDLFAQGRLARARDLLDEIRLLRLDRPDSRSLRERVDAGLARGEGYVVVAISPPQAHWCVGDPFRLNLFVDRRGYLCVLMLEPDGTCTALTDGGTSAPLAPDTTVTLPESGAPDRKDAMRFDVPGEHRVYAILSQTPITAPLGSAPAGGRPSTTVVRRTTPAALEVFIAGYGPAVVARHTLQLLVEPRR